MGSLCASDKNDVYDTDTLDYPYTRAVYYYHQVLLLGNSNSGKSTLVKSMQQIKDIWNNIDLKQEQISYHETSLRNCHISIITLINASYTLLQQTGNPIYKMNDNDEALMNSLNLIVTTSTTDKSDDINIKELVIAIKTVCNSSAIKYTFKQRMKQKFFIPENMDYWFNKADQLFDENYTPSQQDILHCWNRTKDTSSTRYHHSGDSYIDLIDCGGARYQRSLWIDNFYKVDCVIFMVSLTSYCTSCIHDNNKNDMIESIQLFQQLLKGKWFRHCNIHLMLTKVDLFKNYLINTPLTFCFEDEYEGQNWFSDESKILLFDGYVRECNYIEIPNDVYRLINSFIEWNSGKIDDVYKESVQFIRQKFISVMINTNERKQIYSHIVSTIDVENVARVMHDIGHSTIVTRLCTNGLIS